MLECKAAIVTLPTGVLARQPEFFSPRLPEKTAAAERLPLGLADKLFLSLEGADEFDADSVCLGTRIAQRPRFIICVRSVGP